MNTMRPALAAIVTALALLTASGCAVVSDQQGVGSYFDDTGTTTKVKAKLAEDPAVKSSAISVETLKGTVQLAGFVKTDAEKATADRVVRAVPGVVTLRNDLVVVSNQQSTGSYIDDTGITTKVKAKLAEEPSLKSGAIAVETLRGTVQLSGFIKTASEKSTAERVARGVSGVTALRNDLIVMP